MLAKLKKSRQTIVLGLTLTVFVFVAVLGIRFGFMTDGGNMSHCLFGPSSNPLCPASIVSHLAHWQDLFTSNLATLIILIAAAVVAYVVLSYILKFSTPQTVGKIWHYLKRHDKLRWLQYLVRLFASGILAPRFYA